MSWSQAADLIKPHVVRISTPESSGSGFLICNGKNNQICGVATAAHVVAHAHYWEQPIRIHHFSSGKALVLHKATRAVLLDQPRDTAALMFIRGDVPFPPEPMPLPPEDMVLRVGHEIGWLGFPAIPAASLCFFAGKVSAWIEERSAYLVDGVAINGVSGGPAFHVASAGDHPVVVMGVVSAYVPNRATGEALPGLSVVRDVAQFHELAPTFASLDQAQSAEPAIEEPPPTAEGDALENASPQRGR
jgi:hypothetical protein